MTHRHRESLPNKIPAIEKSTPKSSNPAENANPLPNPNPSPNRNRGNDLDYDKELCYAINRLRRHGDTENQEERSTKHPLSPIRLRRASGGRVVYRLSSIATPPSASRIFSSTRSRSRTGARTFTSGCHDRTHRTNSFHPDVVNAKSTDPSLRRRTVWSGCQTRFSTPMWLKMAPLGWPAPSTASPTGSHHPGQLP